MNLSRKTWKRLVPVLINTRHLAYVSNKRITRIASDVEVKKEEIEQRGNNQYIDVSLKNRNPRNLEQLLLEPKPMGFEMDTPNRHYWNKVVYEKKAKRLVGKIVHHSGRVLVSVSSDEPAVNHYLKGSTGVNAVAVLGQVLAIRALEAGIHSVFSDIDSKASLKYSTFIQSLQANGLNLTEQKFIFPKESRDF